jgi:FMN reductase (NADPH)
MHFAYKTGADFSKEMTRSIKEVLKIWNGEKG